MKMRTIAATAEGMYQRLITRYNISRNARIVFPIWLRNRSYEQFRSIYIGLLSQK